MLFLFFLFFPLTLVAAIAVFIRPPSAQAKSLISSHTLSSAKYFGKGVRQEYGLGDELVPQAADLGLDNAAEYKAG